MIGLDDQFDVIVIGGGHAGAEAAWAASHLGARTALITMDVTKIGALSCNPAIGGLAKGQMVREIDALGGLMGMAIDATGIQFRVLNQSKGPAVRGLRAQADKYRYAKEVQRLLRSCENLTIIESTVDEIIVERGEPRGVIVGGTLLEATAVVLTTGTFMRGLMHTGESKTEGGRVGEKSSVGISATLRRLGFELGRLKTGTPPRLAAESINFEALKEQPGDDEPIPFSDMTTRALRRGDFNPPAFPTLEQRVCWITQTCEATHQLIRDNLDRAPLYNGQIAPGSTGPRYCPSIEDKVVRFKDRTAHHVFLEPESLDTNEIYCNGISTSLPADIQNQIVHRMPGCENATILRYGYAVEYDMVWPHQIDATCMTKKVSGFFLAGQINGTSGYEEAAGQGLIAGVNAVRYARKQELVRLRRDQAFVGVMMDDLVTKTPREPYRMFTSRAEFRLQLRADNADTRLTPLGREWGLVDDDRWSWFEDRREVRRQLEQHMARQKIDGERMIDWIRRPQVDVDSVVAQLNGSPAPRDRTVIAKLLADVQYAGYIQRQQREIDKLVNQESRPLPRQFDYAQVHGLRGEAAQTLNRFQPATLGQAGRLAGVNPADLLLISVAMK
jgi:tRNA uridine 5-carboxymethylaminomethyl modification enzyme